MKKICAALQPITIAGEHRGFVAQINLWRVKHGGHVGRFTGRSIASRGWGHAVGVLPCTRLRQAHLVGCRTCL